MLGHQFGQHLVFGVDLLFQELDPLLFTLVVLPALALEGSRAILEELLLPAVDPVGCSPCSSQRSETGTLSNKCRLRMATFSSPV